MEDISKALEGAPHPGGAGRRGRGNWSAGFAKFWADGTLRTAPWSDEVAKVLRRRSSAGLTSTIPESLEDMPSHRVLAVMRGEGVKCCRSKLEAATGRPTST